MQIEITTLIEFDEVAERKRLNTVFTGVTRNLLVGALDQFIEGKFEELARTDGLVREHRDFMHPVVAEVIAQTAARLARRQHLAEREACGTGISAGPFESVDMVKTLADLKGIPLSAAGLDYPKHTIKSS